MYSTCYTTSHQVRAAAAVGSTCRPPRHVRHHALPPAAHPTGQREEAAAEGEGLAPLRQCLWAVRVGAGGEVGATRTRGSGYGATGIQRMSASSAWSRTLAARKKNVLAASLQ